MNNGERKEKFMYFLWTCVGIIGFLLCVIITLIFFTRPAEWLRVYGREFFFKYFLTSCFLNFGAQIPIVYLVRQDWRVRRFDGDKETLGAYYIGSCGFIGAICYWHKYKRKTWKPK